MSDKTKWYFGEPDDHAQKPTIGGASSEHEMTVPASGFAPGGYVDEPTRLAYAVPGPEDADEALGNHAPVVGWLVIVKGPGIGRSYPIAAGMNVVGRGEAANVRLPDVDRQLSRSHARIAYDPRSRGFKISAGEGRNLTYVNGEMLDQSRLLEGAELIEFGDATHVRFVPFCGPHFDWSDVPAPDGDSA